MVKDPHKICKEAFLFCVCLASWHGSTRGELNATVEREASEIIKHLQIKDRDWQGIQQPVSLLLVYISTGNRALRRIRIVFSNL